MTAALRGRSARAVFCVAALLMACFCSWPALAQDAAADGGMTIGQAEKLAANLRQGMTVDEVQKLLGKAQQTALKNDGGAPNLPSKGTLQWSYVWGEAANRARLRVDFTAQPLEPYHVNSWQWLPN
jgi:hypothetical protein